MNKKLLFLFFLLLTGCSVFASHIIGGEMIYEFLSADTTATPRTKKFRITLRLFRDEHCGTCALMPADVFIGIFNNDTKTQYPGPGGPLGTGGLHFYVVKKSEDEVTITQPYCISNAPELSYHMAIYTFEVDLPDNENGYTASYQTCCRVSPIQNVENDLDGGGGGFGGGGGGRGTGSTYACFIPGKAQLGATGTNSSPQFANTIATLCQNRKFSLDFSATDADGDALKYSFSYAYDGGSTTTPNSINPEPPPYNSVRYINGYTSRFPLGPTATIDSNTGIISGIAPPVGDYIISVDIAEYRGGKMISMHRKDFNINVSDCDVAGAILKPGYINCDDFTYTFENLNNSPLNKTFLWEFGDGTFSTDAKPTHVFRDTGIYKIKLHVNEGTECGESDTSEIRVYPGFLPEFSYSECENNPTKFKDLTQTVYGEVSSWWWQFGDETATADTAHARNPVYTYPTTGKKAVSFVVANTKGCIDTINREIQVLGAAFAGRDTTVVVGQPLQLGASEGAAFTWMPGTDLNDPTAQNPVGRYLGNYDSIRYTVLIFNEPDCLDSAFVTVRVFKTNPQVFVPTAFSPNGDGKNDVFRPVTAGMSKFEYFRVYNRWGQPVFSTTTDGHGWDGKINGKEQSSGTFVWLVRGVDYLGKVFSAKGTVTLIR
jgi:gliding motility-associated-like protein